MNIRWNEIYDENKKIDKIYDEKYAYDKDLFRKNAIELLIELGEFVNETKCFKFWTIKKPDKEKVLDEYADCITMTLYFYDKLNMELEIVDVEEKDLLDMINETFSLATKIINELDSNLLKRILSNLLYIGKLLNLTEEEILDGIETKQKIVNERLNSDY